MFRSDHSKFSAEVTVKERTTAAMDVAPMEIKLTALASSVALLSVCTTGTSAVKICELNVWSVVLDLNCKGNKKSTFSFSLRTEMPRLLAWE